LNRFDSRYVTVAACALCTALILSVFIVFPIWVPDWKTDFHKGVGEIEFIFTGSGVLMALTMAVVGWLLTRMPVWQVVVIGGLVMGGGLMLASTLTNYAAFAGLYVVTVGIGVAFASSLPCQTLGVRLFPSRVGTIGGVLMVALSIASIILPPFLTQVKDAIGWRSALAATGATLAVVVPLLAIGFMRVPADVGGAGQEKGAKTSIGWIVKTAGFWIIVVGAIPMFATPTAVLANITPFLADRGVVHQQASYVMSIYTFGALIGSALWGLVADRFGPRLVAALDSVLMALLLAALTGVHGLVPSAIALVALGITAGGIHPLLSALVGRQYRDSFAPALGLISLFMLPYMLAPWLFGVLRDQMGSYSTTFLAAAAALVAGGLILLRLKAPASAAASPESAPVETERLAAGA
jgi:OFA family oxalate/formate antiporter-like MFS transporter